MSTSLQQEAERIRQRQQEAEMAAGRERLLARRRMKVWWNETLWGRTSSSAAMDAQWKEPAKVEEAKQSA